MAVTISVGDELVYVSTLLKNQRLNVNNQQPGITAARTTLQIMLGAPFVWRFNRATLNLAITLGGGTDYSVSIPALGRIEKQWLVDSTNKIWDLQGAVELAKVSSQRRPVEVAPVYDDNEGNITLRFNSVPDQNYTAWFDYQQKAPLVTSSASTFGPVPDEFGYLYSKGLLSECALLNNDARFNIWRSEFLAGLLATQDGLDAQAKSIFYEQMMNTGRTAQRAQAMGAAGDKGRQV